MQISKTTACIGALFLFVTCVVFPLVTLPYWTIDLLSQTNELKNLEEIPSPNGSTIVDEFNVYGGATSTDLTQVLIRKRNERFDWWNGRCIFSVEGLKKTKVKWVDDSQLQIQYEAGTVYRSITEWNGISISYSQAK